MEFRKIYLPSAVLGGDVNIGIPLFFLVKVEFLLLEWSTLSNKFSCDEVTEDCLDLGMVNMVLGLVPELMFKLLLELELDISPAWSILRWTPSREFNNTSAWSLKWSAKPQ